MITSEMIARINELARKQRENILTAEERAEQATLRKKYIDNIKAQVKSHLETIKPVHAEDCDCGCHHHS
jgi:uncharacterized protein YnzC (UPF0291/DUF896 family)